MDVQIRRLGPGDEEVLERIAREADDFDLPGGSAPEEPLQPEQAAAYLSDPAVVHWIAEADDAIVGELLCHVIWLPSAAGAELLLYSIGVRSACRRRGVGTALIRTMLDWAAARGLGEVWVLADNPGAEEFYTSAGFIRGENGRDPVYLHRPVGAGADDAHRPA